MNRVKKFKFWDAGKLQNNIFVGKIGYGIMK